MSNINLNNPEYYINREWSWLEFNNRVLYEAFDDNNPLLERLKFISITSSNLEEFFMVRVAGLKKLLQAGMQGHSADLRSPVEQLNGMRKRIDKMLQKQYNVLYKDIIPKLRDNGVEILTSKKEISKYKDKLKNLFDDEINPVVTPISVSPTHPFPNLVTNKLYIAVELERIDTSNDKIETSNISFIEVPININGRFIEIEKNKYIPIENAIRFYVHKVYNGYKIISANVIRVTRDADFELQKDDVSDLLTEIESTIKRMHIRSIVKLEYEKGLSINILKTIMENNNLKEDDLFPINGMLKLDDLIEVYSRSDKLNLKDPKINSVKLNELEDKDIFDIIKEKDILLYHPYHSYMPVTKLINRAADDDNVLAIKQLLYRISPDSEVTNALIRAAEKGKHVSVIVELRARFDEKRNIQWAKKLEDSGAYVIYGISGLKTHAKALLIVRREKRGIRRYIHLGTGNYNETTAKLYTDYSFFTCDEFFGEDISSLFNLLTGFSLPNAWNHISIAPLELREKFVSLIKRETENAKKGLTAKIIAKMNSLADKGIVKALYEASIAGVKIELIVRGICIACPGIKKISENIKIKSIIGKFLEHSRIYYFYNGGDAEYFLSSADWMTRNLDRRIELLFPVNDNNNKDFIDKILEFQLKDSINTWQMNEKGEYSIVDQKHKKDSFKLIHQYIKKRESSIDDSRNILWGS